MSKKTENAFVEWSVHYLAKDYLPKIKKCLKNLTEVDIWWRPNPTSNSVGNLVLHLTGNLRQWIISGVGGETDIRQRQGEFDAKGPVPLEQLINGLEEVVLEACKVLEDLDTDVLLESRHIQGNDVQVLGAIYHAVEHFSTHTGQIIYITKLRQGMDMAFYEVTPDGIATPTW